MAVVEYSLFEPRAAAWWQRVFTPEEWLRLAGFYGFVLVLHLGGWGMFLHYAWRYPALVGLGVAAYAFGLRHAFDADHIAAVDDSVRYLMQKGKRPLGIGFFFSLGHSTVVFILVVAAIFAATFVQRHLPMVQHWGGLSGAAVSGAFLWLVGILNLFVLIDLIKAWRRGRGARHGHVHAGGLLAQGGVLNRVFGPWIGRVINHSWQMFPIGLLFGLGFDTASEIGLLASTASASATGTPAAAVLSLPILFAAGMSVLDTTDGVLMSKVYGTALVNPLRRLFYNIVITSLSVAVALLIGTVEWAQVLIRTMHVQGPFASSVGDLNLGRLGYLIVGLFLIAWGIASTWWRFSAQKDLQRE